MTKKIGPTGKSPDGKLNDSDDGQLAIAIFVEKGNVIIDFGTPTKWLGLGKQEAIDFANLILKNAENIKEDTKEDTNGIQD